MVNRPAGGARSQKWEKSDHDFYREPPWAVEQIFNALNFGAPDNLDLIYDPCCGKGNILDVAKKRGHETIGSDIIDRTPAHRFIRGNFLKLKQTPSARPGQSTSIICNPPYSYEIGIAENIMRRSMDMQLRRACFIVPIAFMCGQERWNFFMNEFNPSHVLIYSQRPTMPPGNLIETMANPYDGGMADYCVICFSGPRHRWKTQTIWMRPTSK